MKKDQIKKEQTKEPEEKKVKAKKDEIIKEARVTLTNYTIKAVIPTVQYGNIQPEISVCAPSLEEASKAVLPHIEELYAKYCEVVPNFAKKPVVTVTEIPATPPTGTPVTPPEKPKKEAPVVSESFWKAKQMIDGALSEDALNLITDKIKRSVKLVGEEKDALMVMLINRIKELKK